MSTQIKKPPRPLVTKTRAIKDCATGNWTYEFRFLQQDGLVGLVSVPGDEADTATGLARRLTQRGAKLPRASEERKALLEAVIESAPLRIVHQLARPGWQLRKNKNPWMSVGKHIIGAPVGKIEYAPPALISQSHAKAFAREGTLDAWQSRIAAKAELSTTLTICIAAGFAAPLLALVRLPNFSLALYGPSRAGKTTALLCSTSIFAYGLEEDLPNWNSTGARLLESASAFSDLVFPLNEVGAASGRRKNAYEPLRDLYAQYAEGRDRDRHSSFQGGQTPKFRGICISTAEHSVAEYAMLAGEKRDDGELFRAIDIRAVRDQATTILDLAPKGLDQRGCLEELRMALRECHGTAFEPYIQYLQSLGRDKIESEIRRLIDHFVRLMPGTGSNGVARQIATNLGILYASCFFAAEGKILPLTHDHILKALTRTFTDAIDASKVLDPLDMGRELFKTKLAQLTVERTSASDFGPSASAGYWTVLGGVKSYVVQTKQFGSWFPSKGMRDVVLNWLCAEGLLTQTQGATPRVLSPGDIEGVYRRWPHGKIVRSFEIANPFPEKSPTSRNVAKDSHAELSADPDDDENPFEEACGGFIDPPAMDSAPSVAPPTGSKAKSVRAKRPLYELGLRKRGALGGKKSKATAQRNAPKDSRRGTEAKRGKVTKTKGVKPEKAARSVAKPRR